MKWHRASIMAEEITPLRIDELADRAPAASDYLPATPTGGPSGRSSIGQILALQYPGGSANQVLTIGTDGKTRTWKNLPAIPNELPPYTAAEAAKVLTVATNGTSVIWATPQGGGGTDVDVLAEIKGQTIEPASWLMASGVQVLANGDGKPAIQEPAGTPKRILTEADLTTIYYTPDQPPAPKPGDYWVPPTAPNTYLTLKDGRWQMVSGSENS